MYVFLKILYIRYTHTTPHTHLKYILHMFCSRPTVYPKHTAHIPTPTSCWHTSIQYIFLPHCFLHVAHSPQLCRLLHLALDVALALSCT